MASITDVVRQGRGSAHNWRVTRDGHVATLWHHTTAMLTWNVADPSDESVLDWRIGWGSVSDQGGMNRAFKALGLPYRYDRDQRGGGPRVSRLDGSPSYKIIRFRQDGRNEVIRRGLTLREAQEWCEREDTHGEGWFDGYDREHLTPAERADREHQDRRLREAVEAFQRLGI